MKKESVVKFTEKRKRSSGIAMKYSSNKIKKFYSLDAHIYREGIVPRKFKELIGLIASLALRCDEYITYHLTQCYGDEVKNDELEEVLAE